MFDGPIINETTMLALLLCSKLGNQEDHAKPLTPSEFSKLLVRLEEMGIDPLRLMDPDAGKLLKDLNLAGENQGRIEALLKRGGTIALALEGFTNRGIWVVSCLDSVYPSRLKNRLGKSAPPLLYGSGNVELLDSGGMAIVGSRDVDEAGSEFTRIMARKCALEGIPVISGGARGVDRVAMYTAFEENGAVIGILAADLERTALNRENREAIMSGNLVLATAYNPNAGFSVGNAMGRNKYLYALSDYACVVSSTLNKGGTWAGAIENIGSSYRVPIIVRNDANMPPGNDELIKKDCIGVSSEELQSIRDLKSFLNEKSTSPEKVIADNSKDPIGSQMDLFK